MAGRVSFEPVVIGSVSVAVICWASWCAANNRFRAIARSVFAVTLAVGPNSRGLRLSFQPACSVAMSTSTDGATITVALLGNPNTGKSTLFSALVGTSQRIGNYPGVTVEKKVGLIAACWPAHHGH